MALFNKKKKEGAAAEEKKTTPAPVKKKEVGKEAGKFIIAPRVTERTTDLSGHGVYVFDVVKNANKALVAKEIEALYKVAPIKVNIVNAPKKNASFRGVPGRRGGGKKAFVYVAKADIGKINIA